MSSRNTFDSCSRSSMLGWFVATSTRVSLICTSDITQKPKPSKVHETQFFHKLTQEVRSQEDLHRFSDDVLPVAVNNGKLAPLLGHLGNDVCRAEDGLKVEPSSLTRQH